MNSSVRFCFLTVVLVSVLVTGCGKPSALNASTASVKSITPAEFAAEVTRATNAVVVDFFATWCGPCRVLSPMLDRLAGPLADKIKFVKINVDDAPEVAQTFQVKSIPTLIFFREGKVADRLVGLPSEAELKARLEQFAAGK